VKKIIVQSPGQQEQVNAYFKSQASFWKDIYVSSDVYAQIHQDRHAAALAWVDSLTLAPRSQVLEIGCGAGFMAVALAQRGLRVRAIDSTEAMIEQARRNAEEAWATDLLSVDIGDVYSLAFDDGSFDLVIALGVIPWLEQPELAIHEMARVMKQGGYIAFTADNRARLNVLLDPWLNPALAPLKRGVKIALHRVGLRRLSSKDAGATSHSRRFIDKALMHEGLAKTKSMTLGFGPFTLFRRTVIPESLGIRLHHCLQYLANRGIFGFRTTGAHYLVLARKPAFRPFSQSTSAGKSDPDAIVAL
jgi:ubiquinone/menaquinone biosynthesis C-methylase UbiE